MRRTVSLAAVRLAVVQVESLAIVIQAELCHLTADRWPGALARLTALAVAARESAANTIELIEGQADEDPPAVTRA